MDVFDIFRTIFVVVVTGSILVPFNIPLAALAYKIHLGTKPLPMEPTPFWVRATCMALGLAFGCFVLMVIDYWLVVFLGLPAGFVHLTLLLVYVAAGVGFVFWIFALEELLEGVSVFVIYLTMPSLFLAFLLMLNLSLWPVQPLVESFLLKSGV